MIPISVYHLYCYIIICYVSKNEMYYNKKLTDLLKFNIQLVSLIYYLHLFSLEKIIRSLSAIDQTRFSLGVKQRIKIEIIIYIYIDNIHNLNKNQRKYYFNFNIIIRILFYKNQHNIVYLYHIELHQ